MTGSKIRRSMPLFPIGPVMQLTELSARQIRYYEEHQLISPARTKGNQRMFSLNDIDKLLEIKDLIDQGMNMAGLKRILALETRLVPEEEGKKERELSNGEIRRILRKEIVRVGRFNVSSPHGNGNAFSH